MIIVDTPLGKIEAVKDENGIYITADGKTVAIVDYSKEEKNIVCSTADKNGNFIREVVVKKAKK